MSVIVVIIIIIITDLIYSFPLQCIYDSVYTLLCYYVLSTHLKLCLFTRFRDNRGLECCCAATRQRWRWALVFPNIA